MASYSFYSTHVVIHLAMDYKYITKIPHLFPNDPKAEMPDDLLGFRDFLGHMIKASTATNEIDFLSAIPCRKRIKRAPCEGFAMIMKQSIPESYIYWHCSHCDDGGRIADWKECPYDNSKYMQPSISSDFEPNLILEVEITREEMGALLTANIYDFDCERVIYSARPGNAGIVMRGLYGDMDNFLGFLAADSNHEKNKKRRKALDSAYIKVESATHEAYVSAELREI